MYLQSGSKSENIVDGFETYGTYGTYGTYRTYGTMELWDAYENNSCPSRLHWHGMCAIILLSVRQRNGYVGAKREPGGNPGLPRSGNQERRAIGYVFFIAENALVSMCGTGKRRLVGNLLRFQ